MEQEEAEVLAPYAVRSSETAGRVHPEPKHPYRMEYQRDRARVIHSRAFRRLEYKTQVFLNGTGDHLRTRLTHTIEVASISRTIARALGLNEDLAETIALAHDLGHSPFGHTGEETLNGLMRGHGGFEHNLQSLRIVEVLERKYPKFAGLNLSSEVIEGLKKHEKLHAPAGPGEPEGRCMNPSLEAQITNLADEITYYSHDLDDGLDFDLIHPKQLSKLEVWQHSYSEVRRHFPKLKRRDLTTYVIRCLIDREVQDVIETSAAAIGKSRVQNAGEVRLEKKPLIRYSPELRRANRELRKFLYKNLYYHPQVAGVNEQACALLGDVFNACLKKPELLGRNSARQIESEGLHRAVCDYISGMTDRYLLEEHARLFPGRQAARMFGRL
jgi:dGTPase